MTRALLASLLCFSGCGWADSPEERLESLYRQRVAHSPYVLYEFNYAGAYATSSDYGGVTLLDSGAVFSRAVADKLPGAYFVGRPSRGNLRLLAFDYRPGTTSPQDTLLLPARRYVQRCHGVAVAVAEYRPTYGSATEDTGLMEYRFAGCQEGPDSLTFTGVRRVFGGRDFAATVSFPKGNIKAVEFAGDTIAYLEIAQAVIGRGRVYLPRRPLALVPNQPIVGLATYRFYPGHTLAAAALSDAGIYKKVKLPPVDGGARD
jgi:hypothetical protein